MFKFMKSKIKISQEKKLEEKKQMEILYERKLKKPFNDNPVITTIMGVNLGRIHYLNKSILEKLGINNEPFYKNYIEMYDLLGNSKTINEFDKKLYSKKNNLKNIVLRNFKNMSPEERFLINKIADSITNFVLNDNTKDNILNGLMLDMLYANDSVSRLVFEQFEEAINKSADIDVSKILTCYVYLLESVALNRLMILLRYKDKYLDCNELYTITLNLYNDNTDENGQDKYRDVIQKLYPIYKEFYSDIFDEELNDVDFGILSNLIYRENQYNKLEIKSTFESIVNDLGIGLEKELIKFEDLQNIIFQLPDDFIDSDDILRKTYCTSIIYYIDKISTENLLNCYINTKELTVAFDDNKIKKDLYKKRDQYLKNDFSKENKIKEDEKEYEEISTGEEFEIYLSKMFTKLGYNSSLTKTTGDQGADLIIIKSSKKFVVQAKFYSKPVGNKAVQEVIGAIKFYNADGGIVVTNNTYTKSAIELANVNGIQLIDGKKINDLRSQIHSKY